MNQPIWDVVVVGGGPAGLMAGVSAARAGAKVLLVEKGDRLGRKLVISGGGRCNVTNAGEIDTLVAMIVGNGRFMHGIFHQFSNRDIMRLFEGLGVRLKEEDHGRMFPVTDKATTVAETLIQHLRDLGATIWLGAKVASLIVETEAAAEPSNLSDTEPGSLSEADGGANLALGSRAAGAPLPEAPETPEKPQVPVAPALQTRRVAGLLLADGQRVRARQVILAVGGMSVPKTGSTGDGYAWARSAGHTVTPLYPTEVPVCLDAPWVANRSLQGLSLRAVSLTLKNAKGKTLTTQHGDMVFTHFGVSGPAALRLGHYVSVALGKAKAAAPGQAMSPADPVAVARAGNSKVGLARADRAGGIPAPSMSVPAQGASGLTLAIDWLPDLNVDALSQALLARANAESKKAFKNVLGGLIPDKAIALALRLADVPPDATAAHLPRAGLQRLAQLLKAWPAPVTGTLSIEEAFVTGGGVSLKEVDPRTLESRKAAGLAFAGELLDIHAHTGGYNITVAFATGWVAGLWAAKRAVTRFSEPPGEPA